MFFVLKRPTAYSALRGFSRVQLFGPLRAIRPGNHDTIRPKKTKVKARAGPLAQQAPKIRLSVVVLRL